MLISGLCCLILLFAISNGENVISFLPGSSMFSANRDGILIVSLPTGGNATICNYGFRSIKASKACVAMGFPSKGIAILSKRTHMVKNMTMVVLKCSDRDVSLKTCTISTDEKRLQMCKRKKRIVHVACLQKKKKPIVQEVKTETMCDRSVPDVQFQRIPGQKNTGFLMMRQSNHHNFRYVCNVYLNFGLAQAKLFCDLLCSNPSNPRPIMFLKSNHVTTVDGYFSDFECPDDATSLAQCSSFIEATPCDKVYNVALQCGEEIKIEEPRPNVICLNRSMIIEWTTVQSFFINSSLVSLHPNHTKNCLYTRTDSDKKIIIKIPLDYCAPIIKDNGKTITFQYVIDRYFIDNGNVQFKTKESREVFCEIPKLDEIAREYVHGQITYPPVVGTTFLRVTMTLHTGSDFKKLLPKPYDIQFYTAIYAKVAIVNPLNRVKLSLSNCFVTSAESYGLMTSRNSAKIIDGNCPVETYGVQIVPINRWSIGFQFTAFKLAESNKATVNIYCETVKCIVIGDPECGICKVRTHRKKRSANMLDVDVVKAGPISMR